MAISSVDIVRDPAVDHRMNKWRLLTHPCCGATACGVPSRHGADQTAARRSSLALAALLMASLQGEQAARGAVAASGAEWTQVARLGGQAARTTRRQHCDPRMTRRLRHGRPKIFPASTSTPSEGSPAEEAGCGAHPRVAVGGWQPPRQYGTPCPPPRAADHGSARQSSDGGRIGRANACPSPVEQAILPLFERTTVTSVVHSRTC